AAREATWHEVEAQRCWDSSWENRQSAGVVWHVNAVLSARPDNALLRARRACALAELEQWDRAYEDSARALALGVVVDDLEMLGYRLAWLRLRAGDVDGYRRLCATLCERFGQTKDARTAYLLVRICTLHPEGAADPARLVKLAEVAVKAAPRLGWYLHV